MRAFRKQGVSWPAIREAGALACEMFNDNHPFTRRRFRTDGRRIFQEIDQSADIKLFDMNQRSWVFKEIVDPSLYRGVEFSADQGKTSNRWRLKMRKIKIIEQISLDGVIQAPAGR